jgi:DNA-binding response OmpR family regulator
MTLLAVSQHPNVKTILVVDDEFLITDWIARELEQAGFRVVQAFDGHAALAAFESERPDLVVTDFNMPEMNGKELATRIKAAEASVPVILVSAECPDGATGAVDVFVATFSKPVNIARLRREVARIARDDARREAARC